MTASQIILDLGQRFADSRAEYCAGRYNDMQPKLVHSHTEPCGHNLEQL